MKSTLKILITVLFVFAFSTSVFAQDINLSDLLSPDSQVKAQEITTLDAKEDERTSEFQRQLGFSLPEYTDNASYVVTFTDPSPEAAGVSILVDEEQERVITSPYAFSALSIGIHNITFKFTDKDGAKQEIDYMMTVLPRSPIIKPPVYENDTLNISGTGLIGSDILLFISTGSKSYQDIAKVGNEGQWSTILKPEEELTPGIYTIVGYTRKYGYASELSKPIVYEIGESKSKDNIVASGISFSFNSIKMDNILSIVKENIDLDILLGITFFLGSILALIFSSLIRSKRDSKNLKREQEKINRTVSKKEKTLRELFQSEVKDVEVPKAEIVKENIIKTQGDIDKKIEVEEVNQGLDKVITKEKFLKDFESIDPDDRGGKEKEQKKIKVKVSLTSKDNK